MAREFFFSQLQGVLAIDSKDKNIGKLKDLALIYNKDKFPYVKYLIFYNDKIIDFKDVKIFSKRFISLNKGQDEITFVKREQLNNCLLIFEDILDKQIVDINDCKVVRVNDVQLIDSDDDKLKLIAVDVGLKGLLRRAGLKELPDFLDERLKDRLITWDLVQTLSEDKVLKLNVRYDKLAKLHPAEIANIIEQLSPSKGKSIIENLDEETAAYALSELENTDLQLSILDKLPQDKVSAILEELSPDDAADILGELDEDKLREILNIIPKEDAEEIEELLEYDEDTAGSLMTTEYVSLFPDLSIVEAIDKLRQDLQEIENVYYIYIVDEKEKLLGVLSLRELLIAEVDKKLKDIMHTRLVSVKAEDSTDDVIYLIAEYNLLSVPVVDEQGILEGIITYDDVIDLILPSKFKKKLHR